MSRMISTLRNALEAVAAIRMVPRTVFCAVVTLLSAAQLAVAADGRALVRSMDNAGLAELLDAAGYEIVGEENEGLWIAKGAGAPRLWVTLLGCRVDGQCTILRIRASWQVGLRWAVALAADNYDQSVPIASVAIFTTRENISIHAGRDVWLAPGRTRKNIEAELEISESIAQALTQSIIKADPGIVDYWKNRDAQ